jgi:serine phosphatase RsbU (regulator of sigma subunit)/CHASE2 domain-containing sensor protein
LLIASRPPSVRSLRENGFDAYQRLFPRERKSAPATIVEIDERSLAALGQWPWPRTQVAQLVERIAAHEPAAIGFDLLFPEADRFSPSAVAHLVPDLPKDLAARLQAVPGNDARLARAMRSARVVVAVAGLEGRDERFPAPPASAPILIRGAEPPALRYFAGHLANVPTIDQAAAGRGLISADAGDRIVRRVPLLGTVEGTIVPALSLEMWRVASGAAGFAVRPAPGGLYEVSFADAAVPMQPDGSLWIRYSRHSPERFVSAADVLAGRVDRERLAGRLVLVGVTGVGLLDYKVTPLGEQIPGVELHAQLIEQVFDGAYLVRPAWALLLELALLAAGAALLVLLVPSVRVRASVGALFGLLALFLATGIVAFLADGLLIDAVWPSLGLTAVFAVLLAGALSEADRQRRQLREAAARAAGELQAARRIQMGLLPDPAELFRRERAFALRALVEPAFSVGGDFYDCFKLDDGRLFIVVADVSGKGMPAALFMALCKATIKAAVVSAGGSPGVALERAASEIERDNPETFFVTVFAATLDPASGRLEYCNAGHEPPFVRRPGGPVERLPAAERPPVGVPEKFPFATHARQLERGEWLCAVTDGVTEAMDTSGELYGVQRLERVLGSLGPDVTAQEITAAVRDDVKRFVGEASASDDLTLLALRWG